MTRIRNAGTWFWASVLVALLLTLVPVPELLHTAKPFWLGIVVVYWALEAPHRISLGRAFLLGLIGDALTGSLFGEQALRLTVMVFIVLRLRSRLRFFPMPQQMLAILALAVNDRVVMSIVRAFAGYGTLPAGAWIGPLVTALVWPWWFLAFDLLRARGRPRES